MAKTTTETRIDAKAYLKDRDAALEAARKKMGMETLETRKPEINGYAKLIRDCAAQGVSSVAALTRTAVR